MAEMEHTQDQPTAGERPEWMAWVSLGLGIAAWPALIIPICSPVMAVAGLVFGFLGLQSPKRVPAIIGIILNVLVLLFIVAGLLLLLFSPSIDNVYDDILNNLESSRQILMYLI